MTFIFQIIFVAALLVIFFTDFEQQVIPDSVSVSGILFGLAYGCSRGINPFFSALLGAALGFAILYAIGWAGKWWFKKEAMGEGDFFVGALLGAYLGWERVLLAIFLSYIIAGLLALPLLVFRKVKMGQYVPFGPALVVGGIITLFFGERILLWYWGMIR